MRSLVGGFVGLALGRASASAIARFVALQYREVGASRIDVPTDDPVGMNAKDLVTEKVASQPWRFHADDRLGSTSHLDAAPDTCTERARLLRHGVIDDERCARASLDVVKLPARTESRTADVDRSIGVEPITDRNDIRSLVGADRGETSKPVSGQVLPFLVGEYRVHAVSVPMGPYSGRSSSRCSSSASTARDW